MRNNNIHKRSRFRWTLLAVVLGIASVTLVLPSCCGLMKTQPRRLDSGCPECKARMFSEISPEKVSLALQQRIDRLQNFSGLRKIQLDDRGTLYTFAEAFLFQRPASFRFEALGFLDRPVVILSSDGQEMMAYSTTQKTYYAGRSSSEHMRILRGLPFSAEEMLLLSTGNPPHIENMTDEWGFSLPNDHMYFLERRSVQENVGQRIWVNLSLDVIVYLQEYHLSTGELLLDCSFADYREQDRDYPIPSVITLGLPREHLHLRMVHQTFEVNQSLDDDILFREEPVSKDVMVYDLDSPEGQSLDILAPYKKFQRDE